jgi:hypothetical protein
MGCTFMQKHMCKSPDSVVDVQINHFLIAFRENGIYHFLYGDFELGFGETFTEMIPDLTNAVFMVPVRNCDLTSY